MNKDYIDFSAIAPQGEYTAIPDKTLAKVAMTINAGGYDDENQGLTGGWATQGKTGAIYLKCEFVVVGGKYDGRKIWSLIGWYSDKSEEYGKIGRSFIRSILDSARDISPKDKSEQANKLRKIKLDDLDGINFIAQISTKLDQDGRDRNEIKYAITNENTDYVKLMDVTQYNGRYKLEHSKKVVPQAESELLNDDVPF